MEFFVPPAEAEEWYRYWVARAARLARALRDPRGEPPRARARRRRALALLERHERHRVPLPDRLVGARGDREPRRLRPHRSTPRPRARSSSGSTRGTGERFVPHVIEPALGVNRSMLAFLVDAYDEEVVGERERTVLRLHPQLAPVKAAVLPLIGKDAAMVEKARALYEELRLHAERRVRRQRRDRPPLPPPGRDRHAVGVHDRRADARGRHDHAPRPRLARPGADRARGGSRALLGRLAAPWTPPPARGD